MGGNEIIKYLGVGLYVFCQTRNVLDSEPAKRIVSDAAPGIGNWRIFEAAHEP